MVKEKKVVLVEGLGGEIEGEILIPLCVVDRQTKKEAVEFLSHDPTFHVDKVGRVWWKISKDNRQSCSLREIAFKY